MPHTEVSREMRECIQNCVDCRSLCTEMLSHCLRLGGPHADAGHIRMVLDCIQICGTSADFMLRGSDVHPLICEICAEVCRHCAEDCRNIAKGDEVMLRCAEQCERCSESCERMAQARA